MHLFVLSLNAKSVLTAILCQGCCSNEQWDFSFLKDYEEDFEEMDESADEGEDEKEEQRSVAGEEVEELTAQRKKEIEAIQRAMNEENERVGTAQSRPSGSREVEGEDGPKWSRGTGIYYILSSQTILAKALCVITCLCRSIDIMHLFCSVNRV